MEGQDWLRAAGHAAVVVLAVGWASPAWAPDCPSGCKKTKLFLPLSGKFFIPGNPCHPAGENVSLTGKVHIITRVVAVVPVPIGDTFLVDIHGHPADAMAMSDTAQNKADEFIVTGPIRFMNVAAPPDPILPATSVQATFMLDPINDRCASVPLPVTFHLMFGSDGTLLPSSTIMVSPSGT